MAADAPALLLKGGAIFDSEARSFRRGLDVLAVGDRIQAIAPDVAAPAGARVIDCGGAYVLPGLIDCHVHLSVGGGADELRTAQGDPSALRAWKAAGHARRTLQAGFTTVRDLGAAEHLNIHLARAIELGVLEGPRILAAGMGVTMTGGHGHGFIAREADGPDEVRKAVREQLRAGATAIKLFASGGVMTPGVDPRSPSFTEAEMAAGVEEAHKAFVVVGAHAQANQGIKNAIRAGVDSIEHGVWLDDEAVEMMCERGTYLVATLSAPHHIAYGGLQAGIPKYAVDKAEDVLRDHIRSFELARKAGVKLAMGTDEGTPLNHPGENAQEIVRMAEHGLSPAAAIMAATAWAADLLKVECGRLKKGLLADMVIVGQDPLAKLDVLTSNEQILGVVKGGAVVRTTLATSSGGRN
jgi:imidazolonepropionase-like amidohydrolase